MSEAGALASDLMDLHDKVDRAVDGLVQLHGDRLRCGPGCTDCCIDELTVFEVEADRIRDGARALLEQQEPGPSGACAMLDDEGRCRVYEHRPYVCRTQGLPLRWIDEIEPGQAVEYRDICELNEAGPMVELLPEEACWSIGLTEQRLAQLQARHPAGRGARVPLRTLFGPRPSDDSTP